VHRSGPPAALGLLGAIGRHDAQSFDRGSGARQPGHPGGRGARPRHALRARAHPARPDAGYAAHWELCAAAALQLDLPRLCRLDAGRGSAFDTQRAQAQLSSTLAEIPAREAQVAAAQYRIGVLVGRAPAAVAAELEQPARVPALPEVASMGNPEVIVRDRPDVTAAERQAAAQGALVGAAKASYLPKISIGGSAGYVAPEIRTVGAQGTLRYAVGPVISWPLLSLGRVKADVDAAQAGED